MRPPYASLNHMNLVRNVRRFARTLTGSCFPSPGAKKTHFFAKSVPATMLAVFGADNRGANFVSLLIVSVAESCGIDNVACCQFGAVLGGLSSRDGLRTTVLREM